MNTCCVEVHFMYLPSFNNKTTLKLQLVTFRFSGSGSTPLEFESIVTARSVIKTYTSLNFRLIIFNWILQLSVFQVPNILVALRHWPDSLGFILVQSIPSAFPGNSVKKIRRFFENGVTSYRRRFHGVVELNKINEVFGFAKLNRETLLYLLTYW